MKRTRLIHTTAFFLALGVIAPVEARQDKQEKQEEKAKPQKQGKPEKQQEAKAPKQEQQAKPARQQQEKSAQQNQQQEKSAVKQQSSDSARHQQQAKAPRLEQQAKPEKLQQAESQQQPQRQQQGKNSGPPQRTEQATARQRAQPELRLGERGSGRIPDDRFRSNFGREHFFRIGEPVLVGGYSRFQYGGFWFGFVEPWPSGWYYTDDVYIDYENGGYYMYNPYYPGVRFAISVVI